MTARFLLTGLLLTLLASCATGPTMLPPWSASPAAIREVYPDGEYIAQQGRGKSRHTAEASAAAAISRFMTSQIQATTGYTMTSNETNGKSAENIQTINEAYIKTQIDIFGIRYADDAFYNSATKEWQTVAYIDRAEAWQVYEPRFMRQADSFINLFNAAENESDTFKKVVRYEAARQYTRTSDFENAALFGQILYPAKMNAEFAAVRTHLANLPQKIDGAKRNAAVFID
jgi:hypothetical protein